MKNISSIWVALAGMLLGGLFVVTINKFNADRRYIDSKYGNWRKLNLILEQVDANYVDTVNYKDVSEAAIASALARLDPHSVYMPPVEREESDTELAGNFDGIGIQFTVPNDTAIVLGARTWIRARSPRPRSGRSACRCRTRAGRSPSA